MPRATRSSREVCVRVISVRVCIPSPIYLTKPALIYLVITPPARLTFSLYRARTKRTYALIQRRLLCASRLLQGPRGQGGKAASGRA
eukprot:scaffold55165_cov45-Phaeocystis_antarctica.AAC.2